MKRTWYWWAVVLGLLVADRWLKSLALQGVEHDFGWPVFHLVENQGLVFGVSLPGIAMVIVLTLAVLVLIGLLIRTSSNQQRAAIALILIGAASNLFDRLNYGFVIDWADLGRWWPVFNLADVMITAGLLMIITRHRLTNQ